MDTKLTVEGLLADNAELVEAVRRRDITIALLEKSQEEKGPTFTRICAGCLTGRRCLALQRCKKGIPT